MKKDDAFFCALCEKYYANIYKYLYIALDDKDLACDTVQEVFMNAYKNIELLNTHPNPAGYLFKTAKNLVGSHKREIYKRLLKETSIDNENMYIHDTKSDIDTVIDAKINEYEYIDEALSCLSEEKLELYRLYYIEKRTMKDIAAETGIGYTALRMKYVRLRREIKDNVKRIAEEKFVT